MRQNRSMINLPPTTHSTGYQTQRGKVRVGAAGKPPKLRFHPGTFVQYQGYIYEIVFCFRIEEEPNVWNFQLEERRDLSGKPRDHIDAFLRGLGCGINTKRIVYEMFRDGSDVHNYFRDIPCGGNQICVTNKDMIQHAEVLSSGAVEPGGKK
jgi:hypothetical protein